MSFYTHFPRDIYEGKAIDIVVLNRHLAEVRKYSVPHLIVSITDIDSEDANFRDNEFTKGIFRIKVPDNDFIPAQIAGVADFITNELDEDIKLIVCHCEAGISRSAGVAAAISRFLNGDDGFFFKNYIPNSSAYNQVFERFQELAGDFDNNV